MMAQSIFGGAFGGKACCPIHSETDGPSLAGTIRPKSPGDPQSGRTLLIQLSEPFDRQADLCLGKSGGCPTNINRMLWHPSTARRSPIHLSLLT